MLHGELYAAWDMQLVQRLAIPLPIGIKDPPLATSALSTSSIKKGLPSVVV